MSSTPSPDPDAAAGGDAAELRAARRALILFVLALAAAVVGVVVVVTGVADEDAADTTVADGDGQVVELGPRNGDDVAPYTDARRARLDEVEGRRVAVVSFDSYRTEAEAAELLGDAVEVGRLLVAFPSDAPRTGESVEELRAAAVAEAESQLEEISSLVNTVDDPEFAEFYRAELLRYRAVVDGSQRDDVVFGAVVTGRAGDLRALRARAGVRLVDAGDGAVLADDARVAGLRPEEAVTVGEPPFRP